jgi:hypothetical protein
MIGYLEGVVTVIGDDTERPLLAVLSRSRLVDFDQEQSFDNGGYSRS